MLYKEFQPLVSIVIPVYNGSNFVKEAIDSALNQTYKNIEIIVVNDGSRDNGATEQIALSYGDKIRYIHKENGGVSSALNVGIKNMRGEYFSWLSHDDLYTPTKIETSVAALFEAGLQERLIMCCGGSLINESGDFIKNISAPFEDGKICTPDKLIEESVKGYTFNGCCLLIPKKAFDECGCFDETLRYSQDKVMWYHLFLKKYSVIYKNDNCVMNRVHSAQVTQTRNDLFMHDSFCIAEELAPIFAERSSKNNNLLYIFACRHAIYNCKDVVKLCKKIAKEKNLFSFIQKIKLFTYCLYGKTRRNFKKIYYKLFLRVNVK